MQENIDLMAAYLPLTRFKAIYMVDLCHSLCVQAEAKAKAKGWTNVHVVEGDACTWQLPSGQASLVTFSYSLSSKAAVHGHTVVIAFLTKCHAALQLGWEHRCATNTT